MALDPLLGFVTPMPCMRLADAALACSHCSLSSIWEQMSCVASSAAHAMASKSLQAGRESSVHRPQAKEALLVTDALPQVIAEDAAHDDARVALRVAADEVLRLHGPVPSSQPRQEQQQQRYGHSQ